MQFGELVGLTKFTFCNVVQTHTVNLLYIETIYIYIFSPTLQLSYTV
jgi:hypothetical protein